MCSDEANYSEYNLENPAYEDNRLSVYQHDTNDIFEPYSSIGPEQEPIDHDTISYTEDNSKDEGSQVMVLEL